MIGDPFLVTWGAMVAPFTMRAWVAWTVAQRIRRRGPLAPNRAPPFKERSDYPPPNDWAREFGLSFLVYGLALGPAFLASLLSGVIPAVIWPVLFVGSLGASTLWAFRRIRTDDRLTLAILAKRLALPH
jgi:hypothetical protein